jgi:hypothetical protein
LDPKQFCAEIKDEVVPLVAEWSRDADPELDRLKRDCRLGDGAF